MAFDIDDLQIQITAKSINAVQEISKLASSLRTLSKLDLDSTKISKFVNEVAELGKEGEGLKVVAVELTEIARALSKFKVPKEFNNIAQNVKGSFDPQDIMFAEAAPSLSKGGKQIDAFIESVSRLNEVGKDTVGLKNLADVLGRIATASSSLKTLGNAAKETGKSFDRAANGGLANFFRMVKRIAMMRAIRSAIKFLAQAVREGFEMFVTWDREQNNYMAGTAANVEKLSEKWTMLKGQIGALGGALANSLVPIITWVVEKLTALADLLQMIVRSLQGEYTFYRMIYKEAKATTGQAKELKRVLFGFDELNILPSNSSGGASSSGGSWLYEELPIDNKFLNTIADGSNKLADFLGLSKDGQKIIGGLAGIFGVLLGGKALGGLVGLLPRLIGLFKDKNTQLGKQSEATQTETGKVTSLATAFGLAAAAAAAFQGQINNNPATQRVGTVVDLSGLSTFATGLSTVQSFANAHPLAVSLSAPFSQITSAFATMFNTIQRFFNNHPVKIPVAVANGAMSGAGSIVSGLSSTVSNTYSSSAAWSNMSATDLVNYAESTGLNMTPQDRQVAAATVASVFSAFATGGVLGLAGGAMSIADIFKSIGLGAILGFANGGTIGNTGSLFYAGEAGAELVANLGHSTGVMNVSQMQDAVANGNIEVVNAIYALANTVITTVNNKNFDVYMDASKVGQSVSKYQFNQARRGITQGAY